MVCELIQLRNQSSNNWLISNPCFVEWFNITCFGSYVYVVILMVIFMSWSPKSHFPGSQQILFVGHGRRYTLLLVLLLAHFTEFGDYVISSLPSWYYILTPVTAITANLMVLGFYNQSEMQQYVEYLFVTLIFWMICGLARGLQFLALVNQNIEIKHVRFLTSFFTSILCYTIAVNDFFTIFFEMRKNKNIKRDEEGDVSVPYSAYRYHSSNWYSRVTFYWIVPLLHLGNMTPLEPEHFGQLPACESSNIQYKKLTRIYNREKNRMKNSTVPVSLWKCYVLGYWRTFAFGGALKLLGDITGLIPPLGVYAIVKYVEECQRNQKDHNISIVYYTTVTNFINNGFVMAFIVLVATFGQGSLSQGSTHIINVEGIRLKNALQTKIYSKLLKVRKNSDPKSESCDDSFGHISNLISEDVNNIMSCFWIGNYVWAIPLKITLLIYLLYREMGTSAIIGCLCCIVIMIPLQFIVGKKMSSNSKCISEWSDKRIRKVNEVLQGIRFLKLWCWENDFCDKILKQRENELKHLNIDSMYWAILTFLTNGSSVLVALLTLLFYYWFANSQLEAGTLFTSLALFNQLTVPLFIFPIMVPLVISAVVSTRRLEKFLALPEINKTLKDDTSDDNDKESKISNTGNLGSIITHVKEFNEDEQNSRLRKITEKSENGDDRDSYVKQCTVRDNLSEDVVHVKKAVCSWSSDPLSSSLVIECLVVPKGTLNIVVGGIGSGKSSLFSALLGEMQLYSGKILFDKNVKIAYVSQTPWLLNATVKENISFGSLFREKRFHRVISACCLQSDIDSFPDKEQTVVGDRGIMISGGQRQRIAIARALYSKADVIFMDDPLSALDSKVADHIFENGIKKYVTKRKKTVVLTTNSKKLLSHANQIVVMKDGSVKAVGNLSEICKVASEEMCTWRSHSSSRITTSNEHQLEIAMNESASQNQCDNNCYKFWSRECSGPFSFIPLKRRLSTFSGSRYFTHDLPLPTDECDSDVFSQENVIHKRRRLRAATVTECPSSSHKTVFRASSLQTNRNNSCKSTLRGLLESTGRKTEQLELRNVRRNQSATSAFSDCDECEKNLLDEQGVDGVWELKGSAEDRNSSGVKFETYLLYIKVCKTGIVFVYLFVTFLWQAVRVMTDFWLSYMVTNVTTVTEISKTRWYLYLYAVLSVSAVLLSLMSTVAGQYAGAKSRKILHQNMLVNVLHCPISFFESTPLGQIIHRFSIDVDITDKKVATSIQRLIQFLLLCLSAIIVNSIITPWFVVLVIPISLLYYMVQKFYRRSSRDLQQLDNILKSPIISHVSESIYGIKIIRAYGQEDRFMEMMFRKLDTHTNIFLALNSIHRWLGITLDYLGGLIVFLAILVSLISVTIYPEITSPAFVGLAINYTLLVPIYLNWVVKFLVDLETYLSAVERINKYTNIPPENYNNQAIVPRGWPNKAGIQFENVTLQYMPQAKPVIQNLNLEILPGQKVGICGRTGSGKSSLMLSLFKMVNRIEGVIKIDDIDIEKIPLQTLRSRISIIPQDVIMFNGTIRENLDLRHEYSDKEIWRSLKLVHMAETITNLGGLESAVQDGGCNLSIGERQMISLARAILYDSTCLILDEATSSLQSEAEKEFLNVARTAFSKSTILVVTHRVTSLLDFDRILVLDRGALVEDGTPEQLAEKPGGIFSSMLKLLDGC